MQSAAKSVKDYLKEVPEEKASYFSKLRDVIIKNIPKGFEESMQYGMISYVVPHSLYPEGYHCDPKIPLPFVSIASQKNFIALYHMGIYANPKLLDWFVSEYPKYSKSKLDMGKSCIRFKKADQIPFDLIAELMQKLTVEDWIKLYQNAFLKAKK
jgi:hypothetical protein